MRNHIVVDFGDNYTSIFYWCDVDYLFSLRECINKRFKINLNHQSIKSGDITLDEDSYGKLYKSRFKEDVNLKVDILDSSNIQAERKHIYKQGCKGAIYISSYKKTEFRPYKGGAMCHYLDFKPYSFEWKVKDLKNYIKAKTNMSTEPMTLLFRDNILLSDEQLIVDLFLSYKENMQISLKMMPSVIANNEDFQHRLYYDLCLNPLVVVIPKLKLHKAEIANYPLKAIGQIGRPSVIKSWIESNYNIPFNEQDLYQGRLNLDQDFPPTNNEDHFVNNMEKQFVKIIIFSSVNKELSSIYQHNDIRTLAPVRITSFGIDTYWQYNYHGKTGESINEFIDKTLQIPQQKQYFFLNDHRVSVNELITENLQALVPLKVNLAVQVDDDETELLQIIQRLGISRIRSVILKHPSKGTVVCDIPFSKLHQRMKISELEFEIFTNHCKGLSKHSCILFHNGQDCPYLDDIHNMLFNENNEIDENLVLTFIVYPLTSLLVGEIKRFCQAYDLTLLKQVNINFLTGQLSIDILSNEIRTISDLKKQIDEEKGIAPHLQTLFYESKELENGKELIYLNNMMLLESLTLNLVVKSAREVELIVSGNFLEEELRLVLLETATVGELKEMISSQSGIPTSLIILGSRSCILIDKNDNDRVYKCGFKDNIVRVSKRIHVTLIKVNEDIVVKEDYCIRNYENDTVKTLVEDMRYRFFDQGNVTMKKNKHKSDTLLKNVNDTEFLFVLKPKTECNIL